MKRLTQFVKSFLTTNPFKPLFVGKESKLDEAFYESLYTQLTESEYKEKFQKFILGQKLNTLASLRLLFFYFYCIKNHDVQIPCLKEVCWKPVTAHCKFRERYHAVEMKAIELFQQYIEKASLLQEQKQVSLTHTINRCNYILEILDVVHKLEFTLAHRINVPGESVFELIYKYLLQDTITYLEELCNFVDKYSHLILEDHSEMLSINHIYEKTIHYHREITQLSKFSKEEFELPVLNFDDETNRKIQQTIRQHKLKHSENAPQKLFVARNEGTSLMTDEASLVKLIDRN